MPNDRQVHLLASELFEELADDGLQSAPVCWERTSQPAGWT